MNLKNRFKNKTFWIALIPATLLFLQSIFSAFGISFDLENLQSQLIAVIESFFIILAILGIVIDPTTPGILDGDENNN